MRFFTWANDPNDVRISELKKSAERNKIDLHYMGAGIKNFTMSMKAKLFLEALSELDDGEIVCAVDAFDVFFQDDEQSIEERFLSSRCDVLIAVERGYSHQYVKYKSYYDEIETLSPYRYVNAGTVIGYVSALKKIYTHPWPYKIPSLIDDNKFLKKKLFKLTRWFRKKMALKMVEPPELGHYAPWFHFSDQTLLGRYVATNPDNLEIKLDHNTDLFWCTAFEWENIVKHYKILDGKLINLHSNNAPSIVHVPFESKYRQVFTSLFIKVFEGE